MRLRPSALIVVFSVGCTCGEKLPPPGAEKQAPSWPSDALLTLTDVTETSATLTWPEASDDVGVTGYVLTKDGAPLTEVTTTTHTLSGLVVGRHELIAVKARDAAGNESEALLAEASGAPRLTLPTTDESISTDFCAAMQFLTTGAAALQTGATPPPCSTIAAVHGKARSASGSPLPGLSVTVVGHPEWGRR